MDQEVERKKRVLNMLITAHSILRDKYSNLSSFFDFFLLIASCLLNTLIFVDDQYIFRKFHISQDNQQLLIGTLSITVFIISIVLLKVEWKEKALDHSKASNQLFLLLQDYRQVVFVQSDPASIAVISELNIRYNQVNSSLIKIPDKKFNYLKSRHLRKIELSKMIDSHPSSFLWVIKIKLFLSSF